MALDLTAKSPVGATGLSVPPLCYGTSALGDMPATYGYPVDADRAAATLAAILDGPDPFLDSSRNYGLGQSEERIGAVFAARGGQPAGAILSTKLDRDMETLGFDADRARKSLEESLRALNIDRVDILHLHDPEHARDLGEITGKGGALDALMRMKEEGLATAVGLAAGRVDVMTPILKDWDFDCLISHNRFSLVNRNAEPMMDLAVARGVAVFIAAPYAGGVFAKGSAGYQRYVYQEATDEVLAPVRRVEALAAKHGVAPGAAALQFVMRDPRVASVICGVSKPERVAETRAWAEAAIPDAFWAELAEIPASFDDPEASRVYDPG